MPIKSSFVDDDFNPMFNRFRYGTLAQTRHETRQKLSKELHQALLQQDELPGDVSMLQLGEICETVECAR